MQCTNVTDRQTDGGTEERTDRQTDRETPGDSIDRVYAYSRAVMN